MGLKRTNRREGQDKAPVARRTPFKPQGYSEGARRGATREKPGALNESESTPSDGWQCYLESTGWQRCEVADCWERDGFVVDLSEPGWFDALAQAEGAALGVPVAGQGEA